MTGHELSRQEARRIAVRAQCLDARPPDQHSTDLVSLVAHLTYLPMDMTAAIAPSADLVAWSRLGAAYEPRDLLEALERRELYQYDAVIRPMTDLPLHLPAMEAWPTWDETRDWLEANELFRNEILDALDADGPMLSRDVDATAQVPWKSSGWNDKRSVPLMLQCLMMRGEVAIDGHQGNQRLWDLAARVYPAGVTAVPLEEGKRTLDERRLTALGIARARGTVIPGEPIHVADAGEPATVAGTTGEWRVDPAQLGRPFRGRTALLSPFDAVVRDRKRMEELFEFQYSLEMYKPADKRRWGYFALPVLHGDRLVGKVDATADRKNGRFFVDAVHEDVPFTAAMTRAVRREILALADWLRLVPHLG